MPRYEVFLGAPQPRHLHETHGLDPQTIGYRWQTVAPRSPDEAVMSPQVNVYNLPPATLDAASRRISMLYDNTIFKDVNDPEEYSDTLSDEDVDRVQGAPTYVQRACGFPHNSPRLRF